MSLSFIIVFCSWCSLNVFTTDDQPMLMLNDNKVSAKLLLDNWLRTPNCLSLEQRESTFALHFLFFFGLRDRV